MVSYIYMRMCVSMYALLHVYFLVLVVDNYFITGDLLSFLHFQSFDSFNFLCAYYSQRETKISKP